MTHSPIQQGNLIIMLQEQLSQGRWWTHFGSTNDCGSVRLNVVSTGSTTGLMASDQLREEKTSNQVTTIKTTQTQNPLPELLFIMYSGVFFSPTNSKKPCWDT